MKTNASSTIESLEARIAPAALLDPRTITYIDPEGDVVTLKISKGAFTDPSQGVDDFTFIADGIGERLQVLDLSNDSGAFAGANLTVEAHASILGGDGEAKIGFVNSSSNSPGVVKIDGDVGKLAIGGPDTLRAVQSLTLNDLGSGTNALDFFSVVAGSVGRFHVTGNVASAVLHFNSGPAGEAARLDSLVIDGMLTGLLSNSGMISLGLHAGTVKIGKIEGAIGDHTGSVEVLGRVQNFTVTESIQGGAGESSGGIVAYGRVGKMKVGGSVKGAFGNHSGSLEFADSVGSLTIAGIVQGGAGEASGRVYGIANFGTVNIGDGMSGAGGVDSGSFYASNAKVQKFVLGGDLIGGAAHSGTITVSSVKSMLVHGSVGSTSGNDFNGVILANKQAGTIRIDGNVFSTGGGFNGGIHTEGNIGRISVGGSVTYSGDGEHAAFTAGGRLGSVSIGGNLSCSGQGSIAIAALGALDPASAAEAVAIGRVKIGDTANHAQILAGYSAFLSPANPDAGIGAIVAEDWIASSAVAGVKTASDGLGDGFGKSDNAVIGAGGAVKSKIGSITIHGSAEGSSGVLDHYGIVAQQIGRIVIGDAMLALIAGAGNDNAGTSLPRYELGTQGDFTVREVAG